VPKKTLCEDQLAPGSVKEFRGAITDHYWYELFMDDLPVWGFVGEYVSAETSAAEGGPEEEQVYIYTHKSFDINYNGNRVRPSPSTPLKTPPRTHSHTPTIS
jgi:transmembrane 9 superfamily protein 3